MRRSLWWYLRLAMSRIGFTACALLVVLWVRSYRWRDSHMVPTRNPDLMLVVSQQGQVAVRFIYVLNMYAPLPPQCPLARMANEPFFILRTQ